MLGKKIEHFHNPGEDFDLKAWRPSIALTSVEATGSGTSASMMDDCTALWG